MYSSDNHEKVACKRYNGNLVLANRLNYAYFA